EAKKTCCAALRRSPRERRHPASARRHPPASRRIVPQPAPESPAESPEPACWVMKNWTLGDPLSSIGYAATTAVNDQRQVPCQRSLHPGTRPLCAIIELAL